MPGPQDKRGESLILLLLLGISAQVKSLLL